MACLMRLIARPSIVFIVMSSGGTGTVGSRSMPEIILLPAIAVLLVLSQAGCLSDVAPRPTASVQTTTTLAAADETLAEATTSTVVEEETSTTATTGTTEPSTTTLGASTSTTMAKALYVCNRSSDCGPQANYLKCSNNNVLNFSKVPVCRFTGNGSYCANIIKSEVKEVCGRGKLCANETCVYFTAPTSAEAPLKTSECVEEEGYDSDGLVYAYASGCGDDYFRLMNRASARESLSVAFIDIRHLTEKERRLLECFYGEYSPDNRRFQYCPKMLCPWNGRILAVDKTKPVYIMTYLPDCQRGVTPTRNVSLIFMRKAATNELIPCVNASDCGRNRNSTSCINDAVVKHSDEHLCSQSGAAGAVCMIRRVTLTTPCILDETCQSGDKRVYCAPP